MDWIDGLQNAIKYIEDNLSEDISTQEIAKRACVSEFYFQKAFSMLCGNTLGEYIRKRRLTLAGTELLSSDVKIIDVALKYGYDSPESFSKAFTRFHGITPSSVKKNGAMLKSFAPVKITLQLEGGYIMDYRIVEKEAFTVLGCSKNFKYDTAFKDVPEFWQEHYKSGKGKTVCGMFGINIDEKMGNQQFEYMIADNYIPSKDIPDGFETKIVPNFTWAVFPCKGAMPDALQQTNKKIFTEWLPNCKDYEIAAGYCIELYSNAEDFPKRLQDENYYSEMWIPVKKK